MLPYWYPNAIIQPHMKMGIRVNILIIFSPPCINIVSQIYRSAIYFHPFQGLLVVIIKSFIKPVSMLWIIFYSILNQKCFKCYKIERILNKYQAAFAIGETHLQH